jgi:hypothetical protein
MSPKELTAKTIKDIKARRRTTEREFYGYIKEQNVKKKRGWNVRYGGCRW